MAVETVFLALNTRPTEELSLFKRLQLYRKILMREQSSASGFTSCRHNPDLAQNVLESAEIS